MKNFTFVSILFLIVLASCDLEQEVDLDLPEYEPKIVVECYLQPGQPFLMTLIKSASYFDPVEINYVRNADVKIKVNGETITLDPLSFSLNTPGIGNLLDTTFLKSLIPLVGEEIHLYGNLNPVPELYNKDFNLEITTEEGEVLTGVTQILPPVPIDTLEWKFNEDSLAFFITKIQDNADQKNFYRRVLEIRESRIISSGEGGEQKDTIWVSDIEQEFTVDDEIANGQLLTFGTTYEYEEGDTLISTIYHITEDYFKFLETRDFAITANLSPFGQPATVHTNITGGIGIFTGITFDRKTAVIEY